MPQLSSSGSCAACPPGSTVGPDDAGSVFRLCGNSAKGHGQGIWGRRFCSLAAGEQ